MELYIKIRANSAKQAVSKANSAMVEAKSPIRLKEGDILHRADIPDVELGSAPERIYVFCVESPDMPSARNTPGMHISDTLGSDLPVTLHITRDRVSEACEILTGLGIDGSEAPDALFDAIRVLMMPEMADSGY